MSACVFVSTLRAVHALRSFPTRRSSDLVANLVPFALQLVTFVGFFVAFKFTAAADQFGIQPSIVFFPLVVAHLGGRTRSTDRRSTRLNSSHTANSYAVLCLTKSIRYTQQ